MNIWSISIQNIKSKSLYTFLSVFILSLSIALLLGVQQLKKSFKNQIKNNTNNIDLVIGAKGSPLQLVLASVLHLNNPTGNIPYTVVQKISKNPMVKSAIPISYGDNHKGFRIIGTTNQFSTLYSAKLDKGRRVKKSMEVVLGHVVAKQLSLKLGDRILSSHGLIENDIEVHSNKLKVVGILKPTQKVIDRLIITHLESIWDLHTHEKEENHVDSQHEEEKEITSLLVTIKSPRALLSLPRKINKKTNMQAVLPIYELDKLYKNLGIGFKTIAGFAYLILLISGSILFMSLYKMVKERTVDLAIFRTYGANNFQLIKIVAYEGFLVGAAAFILGYLYLKIGIIFISKVIDHNSNLHLLQKLSFKEIQNTFISVFIIIVLSIALAIYPILKMEVSTILSNEK